MRRIQNRDVLSRKYCIGNGVEIGAGDCPTSVGKGSSVVYVDKRNNEELRKYFNVNDVMTVGSVESLYGKKFDFLMAHHVIEHSSNPIQTLINWVSLLKDDGVIFLSIPCKNNTPDRPRLMTPLTHFILDYLYNVTDDDYESREHIGNFLWSWCNEGGLAELDKTGSSNAVFGAIHSDNNDLHWHVYNVQTSIALLKLATEIEGKKVELLYVKDGFKEMGEHQVICKVKSIPNDSKKLISKLKELKNQLRMVIYNTALSYLDDSVSFSLSEKHKSKLFHISNRKLHWILTPGELEKCGFAKDEPSYIEITQNDEIHFLATLPDRRSQITDRLSNYRELKGLELSPGGTPILEKKNFKVIYADKFDHTDTDYLTGKSYFLNPPVRLDIVMNDKLLHEVIGPDSINYVILSHVIEHIPDFIQFFMSCVTVLKNKGKILMFVPDKRYTFDVLRKITEPNDIEEAHKKLLRSPTYEMVKEFYQHVDFNATSQGLWEDIYSPNPSLTKQEITERTETVNLDNLDLHCFTFTPKSFRQLIEHVKYYYTPEIRVIEISETKNGENEFLVHLEICK